MIEQGDAVELLYTLPRASVDLVIADPPYQIGRECNVGNMGRTGFNFKFDKLFDQETWIKRVSRVMKPASNIIVFNDWRKLGRVAANLEAASCEVKDQLVWIKSNPRRLNQRRRFLADKENLIWAVKKRSKGWRFEGCGISSVYYHPVARAANRHPCEKPLSLMMELVKLLSSRGDTVLDPFMGHGVVGQACQKLGRNYVGFEVDPTYFKEARRRLSKKVKV